MVNKVGEYWGLLHSQKGKGGGYKLRIDPAEITIAKVLRIVDGPIAPMLCVSLNFYGKCEDCTDEVTCYIRPMMEKIRDANLAVYEHTSLKDMVESGVASAWFIQHGNVNKPEIHFFLVKTAAF